MKIFVTILFLMITRVCTAQTSNSDVWINEVHYDHITSRGEGDSLEFVEIVMKNSIAGNAIELAKYTLVLYTSGALDNTALNLGRGVPYNVSGRWYSDAETNHPLSGFQLCAVEASDFTLLHKKMPILQDIPAAIAIVYDNTTIVQLLSYEKVFKIESAVRGGGPASGLTTELIAKQGGAPAMENALSPTNHSVSLLGTGSSYNNFQWDDGPTVTSTPCARNTNGVATQTFISGPLPVKWISLAAKGDKDVITVQWKVATETNVERYVIEMANINGQFSVAGQVAFRAANSGNYHSAIQQVKAGTYKIRVKSILLTGSEEYSETRIVRLGAKINQLLAVSPNPVKGGIANLQITPTERAAFTVELLDQNGRSVYRKQTSILQANTINRIEVPLQNMVQGVYQIRVTNAVEQQSIRVVITR